MAYTREQVEASFPGGKWSNGEYLIKSPLRPEERTASFHINPEKATYHDFGTGEGGKLSELFALTGQEDPFRREGAAQAAPHSREAESAVIQRQAARQIWEQATGSDGHEYLSRKGVDAHGARRMPTVTTWDKDNHRLKTWKKDVLIVPCYAPDGTLTAIEQIDGGGTKFALGVKAGSFFVLGDVDKTLPCVVCEGFSTAASVKALTGWNTVAAFGYANLENTVKALRQFFPEGITIAPDAGSKEPSADFDVVTIPGDRPKNCDWNDVVSEIGVHDAKDLFRSAWASRHKKEKKPSTAFTLRRIGDIPLTEPEFLVDDLLETDTLALFFGESGCRKTFAVFDIAASIATGAPYAGRQTKEGTVIYLAGEGTGGLPRRAKAWEMHRGISLKDAPLFTSSRAALLMDENGAKDVESKVDQIAAESGAPSLIVVDTVARSMVGGDENSAKDVSIFIERVDALRRKYGASCILVHHNGIVDKGRLRGSSAWKGALDAEFLVTLDGDIVTLDCKKMKEAAEPAPISFRSHEYTVMIGKTGKEITSLALEPTDERPARVKELSKGLKYALDTYHAAAKEKPELDAEGKFIGVHVESWRPYFYEKATADSQNGKRSAFNRAIKDLVTGGHLTVKNDVYTPVGEADTLLVNEYAKKLNNLTERCSVADRCKSVACNAPCEEIALQALHHPIGCNAQRSHATLKTGETEETEETEGEKDSSILEAKAVARQEFFALLDEGVEVDCLTGKPMSEFEVPPPCGPSLLWLESQPEAVKAFYQSELKRLHIIGVGDEEQRALRSTFTKFSEVSA